MSVIQSSLDGISGGFTGEENEIRMVLVTFIAISWYNVVELVVLVLDTFRRWRGLYFWSLLLSSSLGVFPYSLGFLLKFFTRANSWVSVTILTIGWWVMLTGQSLVLYSRLHLVLGDEKILRRVLYMIIVNAIILHIPTTVLTYGSNIQDFDGSAVFIRGYNIMEKIQMTGFSIQEGVISMLYVIETVKLLRLGSERGNRKIMHQLVGINIIIIIMDLILLGLEYASYYAVQITLKGAIYSLKLKLEFAVLGKLVDVIHGGTVDARLADSVRLSPLPYAGDDATAGTPSSYRSNPYFYGDNVTDVATPEMKPEMNSRRERDNVPPGRMLSKEFSAWAEDRPPAYKSNQ
ncbi:hypothetical protein VTN00DRAFT_1975 [Thermoascus crustaceus]|uniref:uncharacterized protein n=1 Tax=Thermoascus crustaceus TaxID=5088 RepID=UPI00374272E4